MTVSNIKLVGDIGGTNARFALLDEYHQLQNAKTYAAEKYASLADAANQYLSDESVQSIQSCAIAVATRVLNDTVEFTNNERWSFSIDALGSELQTSQLKVINDFTAQALAVPHIARKDLQKVGGGQTVSNEPIAVVGPGTGLGVGGMIPIGTSSDGKVQWRALNSEGGHCSAAVLTEREIAVLSVFSKHFGHVSYERFLSGPGLVNIVDALKEIDGVQAQSMEPEDVTRKGLDGTDEHCTEALQLFCALLGSYAGDMSLVLGASGGVYIGGGIVPRLGDFFEKSDFRSRFESKGRVSDELVTVPTFVVRAPYPGLLGAAQLLM